jgi:hypothetical protein
MPDLLRNIHLDESLLVLLPVEAKDEAILTGIKNPAHLHSTYVPIYTIIRTVQGIYSMSGRKPMFRTRNNLKRIREAQNITDPMDPEHSRKPIVSHFLSHVFHPFGLNFLFIFLFFLTHLISFSR